MTSNTDQKVGIDQRINVAVTSRAVAFRKLPAFLALIIPLLLIGGCDQGGQQKKPVQATVVVRLVHDPEVRSLLSAAKDLFYANLPKLPDGTPLAIELVPELSVPAARRLASGELKAEAWITPLRALADYEKSRVAPLGARQVNCRALFRTPLILVAPAHFASQLQASDSQVSWNALVEQFKAQGVGTGKAPIGYSHGFPESSASGAMALSFLARMASSVGGKTNIGNVVNTSTKAPDVAQLSPATLAKLAEWQRLASHYGVSESYLMERVARSTSKRSYLTLASEQQLRMFQEHRRGNTNSVVGLFAEEGTIWSNYQLCVSDAPWVTPAHHAIIDSFVGFFNSAAGRELSKTFGFRSVETIDQGTGENAPPERLPQDLGELSGGQMEDLLNRWPNELMKPGALMVVLDASGSMEGDSLRAAKDSLRIILPRLAQQGDQIGLVTFASEVKDTVPVGAPLAELLSKLDSARAIGGSAAYDAIKAGIDGLSVPNLNGHRRSLLVITDGEGKNSELSLQGIQDYLNNRMTRYDINVLIVALKREGSGLADLEIIARGANGYFRETNPGGLSSAIQDAIKNA